MEQLKITDIRAIAGRTSTLESDSRPEVLNHCAQWPCASLDNFSGKTRLFAYPRCVRIPRMPTVSHKRLLHMSKEPSLQRSHHLSRQKGSFSCEAGDLLEHDDI